MVASDRETTLTLESSSAAQTEALGRALGAAIVADLVIALKGELGTGKTTLTRGIAAGLGLPDRVTSPTFTLINEYGAPPRDRLIHVDTYRLGEDTSAALAEIETIGFGEILDEMAPSGGETGDAGTPRTVLVIEWADRIAPLLPDDHLAIRLAYDASATPSDPPISRRRITLTAFGPRSAAVLRALAAAENHSHADA